MSMMKRFFVTMAVAVFVVFASGSYAGEEPMMNDTAMNMTMNDTMMNMTMNGTDMANDTIEEPASDDGRRRLLGEEMMNDTMMNMTMNDTMMNMTMNGTDMANDTIEEPASDDGRRRLLDMHEMMNDTMMNDTMMNMTMNDTMGNMTMNGTDMANDTIAEEEPASDDGRRRLRLLIEA
ncbi:hypothetical protein HKI87_01g00780 [Chloropicon roscoffensis]|uniref:Uncharacterized protein n=1 Tax=Chloropicon roscoffensis TaxID=1461544 RepID=A0AAX4NY53_9CHLO